MTPWTAPSKLLGPWDVPGKNTGVGSHSLLQGSSQPRDRTKSPVLQADSLLSEPPGKSQRLDELKPKFKPFGLDGFPRDLP